MSNTDLKTLIKTITSLTGDTQNEIAGRINYSRAHLSVMKKTDPDLIYNLIKKAYEDELSGRRQIKKESPTVAALSASVSMLYKEVAILKGKNEKISPDTAYEKMKEQARLILEGL